MCTKWAPAIWTVSKVAEGSGQHLWNCVWNARQGNGFRSFGLTCAFTIANQGQRFVIPLVLCAHSGEPAQVCIGL